MGPLLMALDHRRRDTQEGKRLGPARLADHRRLPNRFALACRMHDPVILSGFARAIPNIHMSDASACSADSTISSMRGRSPNRDFESNARLSASAGRACIARRLPPITVQNELARRGSQSSGLKAASEGLTWQGRSREYLFYPSPHCSPLAAVKP